MISATLAILLLTAINVAALREGNIPTVNVAVRNAVPAQVSDNNKLFVIYQNSDGISQTREKLDEFAKFLQAAPQYDAWILSYAGKRACVAEAKRRGTAAKRYLLRKGLIGTRIKVVNAGFHEEWAVELWLVIHGTPGPSSTSSVNPKEVHFIRKSSECPKSSL